MAAGGDGLTGWQRFPEFGVFDSRQLQWCLPGSFQHDQGNLDLGESGQQGDTGKVALKSDKIRREAKGLHDATIRFPA